MRRFDWRWLVISSVLLSGLAAGAATRPQYGGTLHVAMRAAPTSLDPADTLQADSFSRRSLTLLMFDTLVTTDENGRVQPCLAVSWQASAGDQRWQFRLRRGIKFHDGTPLTAETAAASLRSANPSWNVSADSDSVIIEKDTPDLELPAELALPRNAILKRNPDGKPSGTGAFHIVDWQPGKKLVLAADENFWRGRAFVDDIEIEMGRSFRDQAIALELGKAELVEIAPEQEHRVSGEAGNLASSGPIELLAVLFTRDAASPEEKALRDALALSIDRASILGVLLQGVGQAAGGILPNWMSGYGFVFPTRGDLTRARHEREQIRSVPAWTLGYDSNDSVVRLIADRIALNAKDAGLSVQPVASSAKADLRLVRIPLTSTDPWVALADVAVLTGMSVTKSKTDAVENLYAAEQTMLASQRIVPLFHLPVTSAARALLRNWSLRPDGTWNLSDAWLESGKP